VRRIRSSAALIGALAVFIAGCGGGNGSTGTTASTTAATASAPVETTQTATAPETTTPTTTEPREDNHKHKRKGKTSPEDEPGGAGDETPIATQALFTGNNGTISPSRVRVPPFIAVNVVLRAKDEKGYTLIVNGEEVAVGEGRRRATAKLDGLRPGGRYVIRNSFGTPKRLVIVANAEPGP
jgi:hypothetical protein